MQNKASPLVVSESLVKKEKKKKKNRVLVALAKEACPQICRNNGHKFQKLKECQNPSSEFLVSLR